MSFLQPFMLWGLLAVSVPIIIHLLNRRRHRTVKWAAMDFLLKATRESRGKKKLKHFLILTCRALAVACLIFAVARPLLGGFMGLGATVDTVVLILDRSASMERVEADGQPSKRELVLRQVADAVGELESARLVLLDSATGEISEVPSPDTLPELSTTGPTDTTSDIPSLLSTTIDYLREAQPGRTEIWLATDLQLGDWQADDSRWPAFDRALADMPTPTSLRVLALPETPRDNHTLRLLSSTRDATGLTLEFELSREESLSPATIPVTLNLDGAPTADPVRIDGQTLIFTRRVPLQDAEASGWGFASLPPDANLRDNSVYFTYGPQEPLQTVLVHDGMLSNEALTALGRAASPPGLEHFRLTTLSNPDSTALDLTRTALLIWAAPLPTDSTAVLVRTFLESGGQMLFLPPSEQSDNSFLTFSWEAAEDSPRNKYFVTSDWRKDEGPWRDGLDGTSLPVQSLRSIKRTPLSSTTDAVAFATWDDESPLLVRKIIGQGAAYALTTLPDYRWSDLEQSALHLVLVQRLLKEGAKALASGRLIAGTPDPEPAVRIDNEASPSDFPFQAGIYRLSNKESQVLALNLPPSELQINQLDPDEITKSLLPNAPVSLFQQEAESNRSLVQEAWRPFLLAVLLFLLAEAILTLNKKRSSPSSGKATATA